MLTAVRRQLGFLAVLALCAFVSGLLFRHFVDAPAERLAGNYLRSGLHGAGVAIAGWAAHLAFETVLRERLRRMPLLVDLALRAGLMTLVVTAAAVLLQAAIYGQLETAWLAANLPLIVALALGMSALLGTGFELTRLVGSRALANFILGTYHRPILEQRILMFLDIAGSTALAERMGELRLHDLVTRFFFDIDDAIAAHRGEVHAYVGDEVIVTWPLRSRGENSRCLACYFAIEDAIAARARAYEERFGTVPRFRVSLHVGPVVVSECGNAKRQISYFGDAMNVTARLQEHCKATGCALIVSGRLLDAIELPPDAKLGGRQSVLLRGRETPVEVCSVARRLP